MEIKFPSDKRMSGGLSSWCCVCHRKAVIEYRNKHPDSARLAQKRYKKHGKS